MWGGCGHDQAWQDALQNLVMPRETKGDDGFQLLTAPNA